MRYLILIGLCLSQTAWAINQEEFDKLQRGEYLNAPTERRQPAPAPRHKLSCTNHSDCVWGEFCFKKPTDALGKCIQDEDIQK